MGKKCVHVVGYRRGYLWEAIHIYVFIVIRTSYYMGKNTYYSPYISRSNPSIFHSIFTFFLSVNGSLIPIIHKTYYDEYERNI